MIEQEEHREEQPGTSVYEVIVGRNTTHFYEEKPVSQELLHKALKAAIRAPNHKLTNPWRFVRVGEKTRAEITELGVKLKCDDEASDSRKQKVRQKLAAPAELIVVVQALDEDEMRRKEDYASIACAIQNMSLVLWADGVGSKWSTGKVTRHKKTYELCEVDREREEIVGFVWVGHPLHSASSPRRPLEEVYRELP